VLLQDKWSDNRNLASKWKRPEEKYHKNKQKKQETQQLGIRFLHCKDDNGKEYYGR
jgi:hypothetical protein